MRLSRILTYAAAFYTACAAAPTYSMSNSETQPLQSIQTGTPFFQRPPVPLNEMQLALATQIASLMLAAQPPHQIMPTGFYGFPTNQVVPTAYAQNNSTPTSQPSIPNNLTINIQHNPELKIDSNVKSTTAMDTKTDASTDAQNKSSNDAQNENKSSAAGGVGSGGTGSGGGGLGGGGLGGGGGSAENSATGGSGGDGGKGGDNSGATTHNHGASSFPFADHFTPDKLREKSKGMWHTCKKHAYKIAGVGALGTYGYLYYRISCAKSVLKNKESWCNWHKEKNNAQLFISSQLINELMFEIATRYSDIMQPQNAALPVQTFFSTINQELKELKRFANICVWLKRLHITAIFPISDKHIQTCTEKIERLEALRNVVIQHVTQQQYASIATRGFSIPIRLSPSEPQKATDQKLAIKKRSS